jgi:hypothetical protein
MPIRAFFQSGLSIALWVGVGFFLLMAPVLAFSVPYGHELYRLSLGSAATSCALAGFCLIILDLTA